MTGVFTHTFHTRRGIYISSTEKGEIPRCITKRDICITQGYSRMTGVFARALQGQGW